MPLDPSARHNFASRRSRAFTLVELLVVLAVVAILTSLMMPAYKATKVTALRLKCASNMRQIGVALSCFQMQNHDELPQSSAFGSGKPGEMMILRASSATQANWLEGQEQPDQENSFEATQGWDGLGMLLGQRHITDPRIFFCPCHAGKHPLDAHFGPDNQPIDEDADLYCNYHYRGPRQWSSNSGTTPKFSAESIILSDGMRTKEDINHQHGANLLRYDLSTKWWQDKMMTAFDELPQEADQAPAGVAIYKKIWDNFDKFPH